MAVVLTFGILGDASVGPPDAFFLELSELPLVRDREAAKLEKNPTAAMQPHPVAAG